MTAPTHAAGPSASERGIPALEVKGVTVRFGEHVLTGMRPHRIAKLKVARAFQNIALSGGQTVA